MPVPDGLIDAGEDFQVVFRPQVLALGLEQVQVIFQRLPLQRPGLGVEVEYTSVVAPCFTLRLST